MNVPSNNVGSPEKHLVQRHLTSIPNEISEIIPDSLVEKVVNHRS